MQKFVAWIDRMDRITAAEVFVRIAERGSMSGAADALDMSRAMVTRYLAEMERWAAARLMHRTTRRLSLTEAGEAALARCRKMLDVAAEMAAASDEAHDGPRGLLRVACSHSLAQDVVAAAVADYLRRHPAVSIDLHIDARPVNLVQERIDLAIRVTNDLDPNLIARPLGPCPSVICASPAYLAAHGTPHSPQDLAAHNCLTYSYFGKTLWEFDRQGERIAVPVSGNLSANESQVLLAAAVEGAGIAMQPLYSASRPIAQGRLVPLLAGFAAQGLGIYGLYASRSRMPVSLRVLLDFLVDRFRGNDPNSQSGFPVAASRSQT
jgi:DNA-binding transcriptional LysR family regulator